MLYPRIVERILGNPAERAPDDFIGLKSLQRVYRVSRGEKEKRKRRPAADDQGGRKSSKGEVQESKIMAQIAKDTLFSHIFSSQP